MRRIVPILITLFLILTIATASGDTAYILCRPGDVVNVRSSPTTKAMQVGWYDCGDEVETDGLTKKDNRGRTWVHVFGFEIGEAWVCKQYVSDSQVTIETQTAYVCAKGRVALRRSPNGKRIKWLTNGAELTVLAHTDEWALTSKGYVAMDCIEFFGGAV